MKADALDVLEAAYTVDGTEREWLERLCTVIHAQLGQEDGVIGMPYRIGEDGRLTPGQALCVQLPSAFEERIRQLVREMPADYIRETFARYPAAVATKVGTPEALRATRAGIRAWADLYGAQWCDMMVINGLDPTGHGLYIGLPLRAEGRMSTKWRTHWDQVATHLAAAHRLRRRVTALEARTADTADAILTPSGRVDHAVGAASTTGARKSLREATLVIDRSRGSMRLREPERALAAWTGLVAARWTLLDHFDSDGKRYVLARQNDAPMHGAATLTDRERQALGYAAMGHTNKLIAYEMGVSASTVGVLLHRAAKKLRARSRAELIERFKKTVFARPTAIP
jgi:DNA-binding CsgD family transcriptional regulator